MNRRQLIGLALAVVVVAANVAVWYARRAPKPTPPDSRETILAQLTTAWEDLPTTPIADVKAALRPTFDAAAETARRIKQRPDYKEYEQYVSLWSISDASRADLLDALAGAVEAIASGEPATLSAYMRSRGMEFDAKAGSGLPALFGSEGVDPHWGGLVPGATWVRVWKPRSLRHISMVQLGETESWVWDNQTVFKSPFVSRPTFVVASRRDPAPVADARVLIEHDESLDGERSPYFFRFWRSEGDAKWRPLALKLVRTAGPRPEAAPVVLF